ncbi:MAG: PEP-utilizing enzyme [Syntrophobacteraceae bacterium]|nr:PEP-utilizing enzyme [Syntrophobacteraceae bacterium]
MSWVVPLESVVGPASRSVGGKGSALALLARNGFAIPRTLCVTMECYEHFVMRTGLRERILLELNRKDFNDMRWEELWDAALRIRNMFLTEPLIEDIDSNLREAFASWCGGKAVAVRSSAADEDTSRASFAGLHESYLNIQGVESILEHVKLVWASLWSDAALLYRQDIGLDADRSLMAVIIQEFVSGERSGVVFSANPGDPSQMVLESVHGLNQGLVDGLLEPDRWLVDRSSLRVLSHTAAPRNRLLVPGSTMTRLENLPSEASGRPPLSPEEVLTIARLALRAEEVFAGPQDMEWTIRDGEVVVLQSRPVTMMAQGREEDKRTWYLSLRRSFGNLKLLRTKIEEELLPAMVRDAEQMACLNLRRLSDEELAEEIRRRKDLENRWNKIYWEEYIPFAHGVRLFGQFYNDVVRPADPYEFVRLLGATEMESLERNRMMEDMASMVRSNPRLRNRIVSGDHLHADDEFLALLTRFIERFGDLSCAISGFVHCSQGPEGLLRLVLEMAEHPPVQTAAEREGVDSLKAVFLSRFAGEKRVFAGDLLDLARASYRLRDDDNIKLARIEAQKLAGIQEGQRRIEERGLEGIAPGLADEVSESRWEFSSSPGKHLQADGRAGERVKPRQLRGQPAGPGLARGPARVIRDAADLLAFKHGEVLVCDAVDPNMTFVVPLASAVVERRGGMLIHGAIIAREYGLPCVTGVVDITGLITTGDIVTVDGFLGLVTVGSPGLS